MLISNWIWFNLNASKLFHTLLSGLCTKTAFWIASYTKKIDSPCSACCLCSLVSHDWFMAILARHVLAVSQLLPFFIRQLVFSQHRLQYSSWSVQCSSVAMRQLASLAPIPLSTVLGRKRERGDGERCLFGAHCLANQLRALVATRRCTERSWEGDMLAHTAVPLFVQLLQGWNKAINRGNASPMQQQT